MEQKEYERPRIEIILIDEEEVIVTSGNALERDPVVKNGFEGAFFGGDENV